MYCYGYAVLAQFIYISSSMVVVLCAEQAKVEVNVCCSSDSIVLALYSLRSLYNEIMLLVYGLRARSAEATLSADTLLMLPILASLPPEMARAISYCNSLSLYLLVLHGYRHTVVVKWCFWRGNREAYVKCPIPLP